MNYVEMADIHLDRKLIAKEAQISETSPLLQILDDVLENARPLLKPKAIYKISYIVKKSREDVNIDEILFKSRILGTNLAKVGRVFPYIITCGDEFDNLYAAHSEDIMKKYLLDALANYVLTQARERLAQIIQKKYALGQVSKMSPGSLSNWPIEEQKNLFALFGSGSVKKTLGVILTESYLMKPVKSISGIIFESEKNFYSCQLCPRDDCPSRRVPYNEELLKEYD